MRHLVQKNILVLKNGGHIFDQGSIRSLKREFNVSINRGLNVEENYSLEGIIIDYASRDDGKLDFQGRLINQRYTMGVPTFLLLPTFLKKGREVYTGKVLEHLLDSESLNRRDKYYFIALRVPREGRPFVCSHIFDHLIGKRTIEKGIIYLVKIKL